MKYLDSGSRLASDTLAYWLENVLSEAITELRLQTGFFSLDGIGLLAPALAQGALQDLPAKILIGSNDGHTLRDDLAGLATLLGIPRSNAHLGVISFSGGYFHPKTYHVRRHDGSEAAFVGSANLTARGLSVHVEAGIALDTREGDDPQQLSQIASAIDSWFSEGRKGMTIVNGIQILDDLVANGILSLAPPPQIASPGKGDKTGKPAQPGLKPLCKLPPVPHISASAPLAANQAAMQPVVPIVAVAANQQSAAKPGFPEYFLFDSTAISPTSGANALSGKPLPGSAVGIVITLTKDSIRHFSGKTGTANITLPVLTVPSLRFGVGGSRKRPWANYDIRTRFIGNGGSIATSPTATSVQAYGYTKDETSSQNIRLGVLMPAVIDIVQAITKNKWGAPKAGDLALLEWPTPANPTFRLSFLEKTSTLYASADALFSGAKAANQLVGKSACWLPPGVSPVW